MKVKCPITVLLLGLLLAQAFLPSLATARGGVAPAGPSGPLLLAPGPAAVAPARPAGTPLGPAFPAGPCTVDDSGGADYNSIQDAVDDISCTTIDVAAGEYVENVVIARDLTLVGAGPESTAVGYAGQVFLIDDSSAHVSISGVMIEGVYYTHNGTGIYNWGTLTLTNVLVTGNESGSYGGGIYNRGTMTIVDSTISSNFAAYGAGIYNYEGLMTIQNCEIAYNFAYGTGGGIYNNDTMIIADSEVLSNTAYTGIGYGGGIRNDGPMTMTNCLVQGNTAALEGGGFFVGGKGALWLANSTVSGNDGAAAGGGIFAYESSGNESRVTLVETRVSGNTANYGGGIHADGQITLDRSSVSDNVAGYSGGGIDCSGSTWITASTVSGNSAGVDGGGIHQSGTMALTNVTISGNSADVDGGGIYVQGEVSLHSVTVAENLADADADGSGNGGGIAQSGYATATNTIIGPNYDLALPLYPDCSGTFTSLDYNLVRNNSGCSGFTAAHDQVGSLTFPLDPHLSALGDYGGPTLVHALQYSFHVSSPAIDAGTTTDCLATDQRGIARPVDRDGDGVAVCDIGAYEATTDEPADLAIAKTVTPATAQPDDTITYTLTFSNVGVFAAHDVRITDTLPSDLANASYVGSVAITAVAGTRFAWQVADLDAGMAGVIIVTGQLSTSSPAGSLVENSAVISTSTTDSDPSNNSASAELGIPICFATPDDGATVYSSVDAQAVNDAIGAVASGGTVKVAGTCASAHPVGNLFSIAKHLTLRGGYSPEDWSVSDPARHTILDAGGQSRVVYIHGVRVILQNLYITGGRTTEGAGVLVDEGDVALQELYIYENTASYNGGGVLADSSEVTLVGTHLFSNTAIYYGGGLCLEDDASAALTDTHFYSNSARLGGGVYDTSDGSVTLSEGSFSHNTASGGGGGLFADYEYLAVNGTEFHGNEAPLGGALYIYTAIAALNDVVLESNVASTKGGGLYMQDTEATLSQVQFRHNRSNQRGGGAYIVDSDVLLDQASLAHNVAATGGGGIYIQRGRLTLNGGSIQDNRAQSGGGIYLGNGILVLTQTGIVSNTAGSWGGGLYLDGSASLTQAAVAHNSSGSGGGGMYLDHGAATLDRSAVVSNTSEYGAGIYNTIGELALVNTTISQNTASVRGGGLLSNSDSTSVLTYTTIAGNTAYNAGGIYGITPFTVTVQNSLVAENSPNNCYAVVTSNGNNLEDGSTCGFIAAGDQQETDAEIGPLQNNGGDTLSHALLPGSPAIDAGLCLAGITTDQRGWPRPNPVSAGCDVGAYESSSADPADVAIVKTVTPALAAPGTPVIYTLVYSNVGSVTAVGVVITDIVPVVLTGTSYTSSGAAIAPIAGKHYAWHVQNLAPGEGGIITITGVLQVPLAAGPVANTAVIASATRDGDAGNNHSTAQLVVPNVAPVADDRTVPPVSEELPLLAPLGAYDPNGDPLDYAIVADPVRGTVSIVPGGRFVYTPTNRLSDYMDAFTFVATDTAGLHDEGTITVPVLADDDPPFISNIHNQRTGIGVPVGPVPFTIGDVDTPIPTLTLSKDSSNPTLVPLSSIALAGAGRNRTVTITPTVGISGTALITLTVSDGHSSSYDCFVLSVGVNSPPEFTSPPIVAGAEDHPYVYNVAADDADPSDALTITASVQPPWLTLIDHHDRTAILGGTPLQGDVGAHLVVLLVQDGNGGSGTQVFTLTIVNVNDPPLAQDDAGNTDEDTPLMVPVLANDQDPDGDPLTVVAVGAPLYGHAVVAGNAVFYTPTNRTATYSDPFTYTISDGELSDTATVTVTVVADDDPPSISDIPDQQTRSGGPAGPLPFTIDDVDTPIPALTLAKASSSPALVPPANIILYGSGRNRAVTVAPVAGMAGTALITITVSDGHSSTADTFALEVLANHDPAFSSTPVTTATEDILYEYAIVATDADVSDTLAIAAPVKPAWLNLVDYGDGSATLMGMPIDGDVGDHSIVLVVADNMGGSSTQAFTLTVANVNDPPRARDDAASTAEVAPVVIPVLANDEDDDGDPLVLAAVDTPAYGSATVSGNVVLYTPTNRTATYTDTFTYSVSDGVASDTAGVAVTVLATDGPPFISNIRNQHTEAGVPAGPTPFAIGDADTPLDTLALAKTSSDPALVPLSSIALGGSGPDRTVTITPTAGMSGTAIISIIVDDGTSTAADSFILAVGVNSPPEFTSAPVTAGIQNAVYVYHVTTADADPADALTITARTKPAWLNLVDHHNRQATLVGKPPSVGEYAVILEVSDGAAVGAQTFTITVSAAASNWPPVANAGADQTVPASTVVTLDGAGSFDPDSGDALAYHWVQVGGLPVSLSDAGAIAPTFAAPPAPAVLTFILVVTDTGGLSDGDRVVITVAPVQTEWKVYLPTILRASP